MNNKWSTPAEKPRSAASTSEEELVARRKAALEEMSRLEAQEVSASM